MNKVLKYFSLISLVFMVMFSEFDARSRKSRGKNISAAPAQRFETQKSLPTIEKLLEDPQEISKSIIDKNPAKLITGKGAQPETKPIIEKDSSPEEDGVYLNFENAELSSFINYIAERKKINILPDKSLSGNKISLNIRNPMTVDKAWDILHTVSDMAGFSIVKVGDLYKIVPKDKKLKEPLPSYINVPIETLPDSDENIRYVSFLTNVKVSDVKPLLDGMLGAQHAVIPQENVNGVIIIDKSLNIKAAMKIVQELDRTGLQEAVIVLKLKEANAVEVRDLLKSLVEEKRSSHPLAHLFRRRESSAPSSYFAPGTKIIAEERTNSLILLGTKSATEKIEQFIVHNIDKELVGVESPLHVYELQYMDAKQIVEVLKEVTTSPDSPAGQQATKYGAVRSGVKYFKPMTFKADEEGNRIIVSSTDKKDWKLVKKTISNLDKPQPQVAIETLIVTVDTSDGKEFGGQTRNKKRGMLGKGINFQSVPLNNTIIEQTTPSPGQPKSLLGNLIAGITGGLGKTLLTFGRENNIWSIFEMLNRQTHTSVVAQPFLTVANKYEAEVVIGETKRITSEEVFTSGSTVAGKKDAKAAIELKITPQINIDGIINLKISIKNNEFINNDPDNKQKRELETVVSVANGQVLALGGFVKTKVVEDVSKTPILGDIPLLGWFFKGKGKTITKQNILMFISPTIIKPRELPGVDLYSRMKLHEAKEGIERSVKVGKTMDPFHDWFFDTKKETYAHKVDDYATARYQPVTVDIKNDPYYRVKTQRQIDKDKKKIKSKGK